MGTPGSQPGKSGVGGVGNSVEIPPLKPQHDLDDTQPQRNVQAHHNRAYIHADWAPAGSGGGHPKISGGIEIDLRTGNPAPRGLNRINQRYELTQSEIQTRRQATAASEYAATLVCLGENNQYEVRGPSGNCYDVAPSLVTCDCPDFMKQDLSGYGIVRCKHIWIVITALADPGFPFGLPWGTSKLAQAIGINERTVQRLCEEGFFPATKVNSCWIVQAADAEPGVVNYQANMWPYT